MSTREFMLFNPRSIKHHKSGFTLMEMLTVIAVILLLAAILFPMITKARMSAKQSACSSNLHQASLALSQYIEDQGDYPMGLLEEEDGHMKKIRMTSPLAVYAPGPGVFLCPLDKPTGRTGRPPNDRLQPRSYAETWNLWEGEQGILAWQKLASLDQNPIVFRCYLHEDWVRSTLLPSSYGISTWPTFGLAARKDGSVFYDRRPLREPHGADGLPLNNIKFEYWAATTPIACPSDICDGQEPPEFVREG